MITRKAPRNAFEAARLAKVLSVDPDGIARSDVDGADRPQVFRLLHSFDHVGLSDNEFIQQALELLELPNATLETVPAHYRAFYAGLPAAELSGNLTEAAAILKHRFTFTGETLQLPERIDWDDLPSTSPHWPWELNRFGFLDHLLVAYRETRERQYAEKAVELILAFITDTDIADSFLPGPDPAIWHLSVQKPHIWLSHLEIGFHIVAWGRALATLLPALPDLLTPIELLRIIKSVHDQLHWLDIITPEGGHGNGLIAGAGCALRAMALFPALRDTPALAKVALGRLTATLDIQVLPDGVQHELTPHYHFCVCNELALTLEALTFLPVQAPPHFFETLRAMWRYVRQTITPDGLQVAFNDGDADLGWWTRAGLERSSVQALLGDDAHTELTSTCYPYAGVMLLRQGNRFGRDELYLAFDGGPFGNVHQHEDALSFWLSAYGRSFIVDPGRYLYDYSNGSWYNYLISTKAHSTIRIDDRDQNSRAHPDRWVSHTPLPLTWAITPDGSITASASYDLGYGEEQVPVRHTRTIRFVPDPGFWMLEDVLDGDGMHAIESRFQFAIGDVHLENHIASTTFPDANLAIFFATEDWDDARIECGQEHPRAGWHAPRLNVIEPAPALALYAHRLLPCRARLLLAPYRGTVIPDFFHDRWRRMRLTGTP